MKTKAEVLNKIAEVRQKLAKVDAPDQRSIDALDVAERFLNGQATRDELKAALLDAWDALDAAWEDAMAAAWDDDLNARLALRAVLNARLALRAAIDAWDVQS